jgi:hypothetical protein
VTADISHPPEASSRALALADYTRGPLALFPGLVLLLIIQAYSRLGQWPPSQVLALSLGMTSSMVITSGFVQAVSRRGSVYMALGDPGAAGRFLRVSLTVAGACVVAMAALLFFVATGLGLFALADRLIFGLAFVGLAAIWMLAAGLSLVQATGWLGLGLAAGLISGLITDRAVVMISGAHLVAGTLVGFAVALGLMLNAVNRRLDNRSNGQPSRTVLPPAAYLVHEAAPYFVYGSLYMVFILLPHVLGWLGAPGMHQERMSAIASLEAGLTLSLPPVVLAGGVAEHALRLFWLRAREAQASVPGNDLGRFGRILSELYNQQLQSYLAVSGICSFAMYVAFHVALRTGFLVQWVQLRDLDTLAFVFHASLIAYFLVGWGLFNCTVCVTLARPGLALRAVLIAMAVMVITGIPLSREINLGYAAVAFIIGAAAFILASSRATSLVLESADYYYFSSF